LRVKARLIALFEEKRAARQDVISVAAREMRAATRYIM
jgi:hypothetical protein